MEIVAVDIGGTHARFALAEVEDGKVTSLGDPVTLKTADHASLHLAWQAFSRHADRELPRAGGIAVASPIGGDTIKLTNNSWVIRPALIRERLGLDSHVLINDFSAVGHAVAHVDDKDFFHVCGPDAPLPDRGAITVCGPGTGLGVAQVFRSKSGYHVIEAEGGHMDFSPTDALEDRLLERLRSTYTRVSAERVCSGPGIVPIYETLAEREGEAIPNRSDREIWNLAFDGREAGLASSALDRFCLAFGTFAGNLALAHGSTGVVIAGGLGLRLKDYLVESGFEERFVAKGRFQHLMQSIPVKLITHPQPGLLGAAAAYAQEHTL